MTAYHVVELLEIFASIGFFIWIFYGPWSNFVVDLTRQNLFEIRDSVFSLAADGKLDSQAEPYQVFRERINRMIRFCHHFTLSNIVAAGLFSTSQINKEMKEPGQGFMELVRSIPDAEVARQLERQYIQAVMFLIASITLRSMLLIIATMFLLPFFIIAEMLKGAKAPEKLLNKFNNAIERDLAFEVSTSR